MINCIRCTRWRKLSDYRPYFSKKRNKEYLRKTCVICIKEKDLIRYSNFSKKQKDSLRERTREYAAARRRKEGKPVRNITKKGYGSGRVIRDCKESVDPLPLIRETKRLMWAQSKIAIAAKVDVRRVYDWEHNIMKINIDAADNLCLALGTSLEILYPYEK